MKQRMISFCLATVMFFTAVVGADPGMAVRAGDSGSPAVVIVEAKNTVDGTWNVNAGDGYSETDTEGNEVFYMQPKGGQYNNARYCAVFDTPGNYQMQMVMAVPNVLPGDMVHFEWEILGTSTGSDLAHKHMNLSVTQTEPNEYKTFDGPIMEITQAGEYDLKIGDWVGGAEWKLAKFIFTQILPPTLDNPHQIKKEKVLSLDASKAVEVLGTLSAKSARGDYQDYAVDVEETGDYVMTYQFGSTDSNIGNGLQVQLAELKEDYTDSSFTTKFQPVQLTRYYEIVYEKQMIHLEKGRYIMRIKALNAGVSLQGFTVSAPVVTRLNEDKSDPITIDAVDFNNGDQDHAIQNVSNTNRGNIGYASPGLSLDYALDGPGGLYQISYEYTSQEDYTLNTQLAVGEGIRSLAVSRCSASVGTESNWFNRPYQYSEPVSVFLPAGSQTLKVCWNTGDLNIRKIKITYEKPAAQYVSDLITALPDKEELTPEQKAQVDDAQESYDALTDEQKTVVGDTAASKLQENRRQMLVLELEQEFLGCREDDYRPHRWEELTAAKEKGLADIKAASVYTEAKEAFEAAQVKMASVLKKVPAILVSGDKTVILTQSKSYRQNGSLNTNTESGNYADYYIDVEEEGDYTFTYALYSTEAVTEAFAVKYYQDVQSGFSEYPEEVTEIYKKEDVPQISEGRNFVREICGTIRLKKGEQTLRLEALSDKISINRIKISKKQEHDITFSESAEEQLISADSLSDAGNGYEIVNGMITGTEDGTFLDYAVSLADETPCYISYNYAYEGMKSPTIKLYAINAEGEAAELSRTALQKTAEGEFIDSGRSDVLLPAGTCMLRIIMEGDGVDLKGFSISRRRAAESIRFKVYRINLQPGETFYLCPVLTPQNATSTVFYQSEESAVASVNEEGVVMAKADGTTTITASADGQTAKCIVVVGEEQETENPEIPEEPVKLTPKFAAGISADVGKSILYVGGNTQNTTRTEVEIPTGAKLASVSYTSASPQIASVDASGLITAKKEGTAVILIKVSLLNGETANVQTKVTVKRAYIKPEKAKYTVKKGKTVQLNAEAVGSDKKITFKIADKKSRKLAKVTKKGRLKGLKKGTAKVTAVSGTVKTTFQVKIK